MLFSNAFNPFASNAPIPYTLKTENGKVSWCFQKVEKGCIQLLFSHWDTRAYFLIGDCKKTVATNEVAIGEEEELSINFHKLLLSNKTTEFRNYLKQRIKLRIIANQILLSNEPKPDEEKANTLAAGICSVLFRQI